jgi:small-conductance mechanosensitive channel
VRSIGIKLPLAILFLGILLVAAGLVSGDAEQIFRKAVFVCLECIGIG